MARPARTQEEIDGMKEAIVVAALNILVDEGFDRLSMARLGKHMGMTTANLYNYFQNKDELYNVIIIRGYEQLHRELTAAVAKETGALERVMALFQAYIDFGTRNVHYYYLMFTMMAPKYLDYLGTESEGIATEEKATSLQVLEYVVSVIDGYTQGHAGYVGVNSKLVALQYWGQLHGLISLVNSGNLKEADDDPQRVLTEILRNLKTIIARGIT